jgi:hypothetical protein
LQPNFSSIAQKIWVGTKMFSVARSLVDIEVSLIKQLKHPKVFQTMIKKNLSCSSVAKNLGNHKFSITKTNLTKKI